MLGASCATIERKMSAAMDTIPPQHHVNARDVDTLSSQHHLNKRDMDSNHSQHHVNTRDVDTLSSHHLNKRDMDSNHSQHHVNARELDNISSHHSNTRDIDSINSHHHKTTHEADNITLKHHMNARELEKMPCKRRLSTSCEQRMRMTSEDEGSNENDVTCRPASLKRNGDGFNLCWSDFGDNLGTFFRWVATSDERVLCAK